MTELEVLKKRKEMERKMNKETLSDKKFIDELRNFEEDIGMYDIRKDNLIKQEILKDIQILKDRGF